MGRMRTGTLRVLEPADGLIVSPTEGMVLWFGRNRPDVHICVGADDLGVSRRHGTLEYTAGSWWVRTLGARPVRVGRDHVVLRGDEPVPLPDGRTSLQVEGLDPNEVHVLRVVVVGPAAAPRPVCGARTRTKGVRGHPLDPVERMVTTVVAQRLLRHDPGAALLTSGEAAEELEALRSGPADPRLGPRPWTSRRVEHLLRRLRGRLAAAGVAGLVPEPGTTGYDSVYRRTLVDELVRSGTLTAADLRLLDPDEE